MRRGCMPSGDIKCDNCHRTIPYSERYLAIDEEDGVEVDKGTTMYYCVDCALKKGYAYYKQEKSEKVLTFFPEPDF